MAHVNKEVHNMKKKSLILVTIVLIGYYFLSSHSTERKYQVLNEILTDTDWGFQNLCNKEVDMRYSASIFDAFDFKDQLSVFSQYAMQRLRTSFDNTSISEGQLKFIDEENEIKFTEVVSNCYSETTKTIKNGDTIISTSTVYGISLPILSMDGKTVVIQVNYNCGLLCGEGILYVFKRVDGRWRKERETQLWIS